MREDLSLVRALSETRAKRLHTSYRRSIGSVGSTLRRPCFPRRLAGTFLIGAFSSCLLFARLAGFLLAGTYQIQLLAKA